MIHRLYKTLSKRSAPALKLYLNHRIKTGKEDPDRVDERYGIPSAPRPDGKLIWIHAASVGEAQAGLILINEINQRIASNARLPHFLVTTGTRTSAELMAKRLPSNATHQYNVLDHPDWVRAFFDHWRPNIAFWMESELWPNTLKFIKKRHVSSALINARLSQKSFESWQKAKQMAKSVLSSFDLILCQTNTHKAFFEKLGESPTTVTDNIKYSASPLQYDQKALNTLKTSVKGRPIWLYASTHDGEEHLACQVHQALKIQHPNLLTIIVPRHPERRKDILKTCKALTTQLRSKKTSINKKTEIYIADTLGELGLFYKLCDIAVIGRSFSNDGGGGHNPIEACLLDCIALTGPNYQNQKEIFDAMVTISATRILRNKEDMIKALDQLLENEEARSNLLRSGKKFAKNKAGVINHVMDELEPLFLKHDMPYK